MVHRGRSEELKLRTVHRGQLEELKVDTVHRGVQYLRIQRSVRCIEPGITG
jgi:hypothetical protein